MTLHSLPFKLILFLLVVSDRVEYAWTFLLALASHVFLVHYFVELIICKTIATVLLNTLL